MRVSDIDQSISDRLCAESSEVTDGLGLNTIFFVTKRGDDDSPFYAGLKV